MDDSEDYMNVKFTKTDSRSPTQAESDVSYAELNVKTLSAARVRTDGDGLNSTYAELNFRRKEPHIDQGEDPPISSGPGGLSTTAQTEQACSQDWIRNEDLCYFISTFTIPYGEAKELCSHLHSKLLEINSTEEEKFVTKAVEDQDSTFWVGKCKVGEAASNVVYKVNAGKFECSECKSGLLGSCKNDQHRFICEKPAPLCPDIPEKIQDLCQKPMEPT